MLPVPSVVDWARPPISNRGEAWAPAAAAGRCAGRCSPCQLAENAATAFGRPRVFITYRALARTAWDGPARPAPSGHGQTPRGLHLTRPGPAASGISSWCGPNCRAAASVLRRLSANRSASAFKTSLYLRRLLGDTALDVVAITEEIYLLLLSIIPRACSQSSQRVMARSWTNVAWKSASLS